MKNLMSRVAIVGFSTLGFGFVAHLAGAKVNTTTSIPVGLYWESAKPAERNDYVIFCPPQAPVFDDAKERGYIGAGFCPGGYGYLMKRVLAVKNDRVSVTDVGVRVNEQLLPRSARRVLDGDGRAMPRYHAAPFTLADSEMLVMGDGNSNSFDARYFGPIPRSQIRSVIRPVFTW
jgi:conjugative transfer signal peptidase TraF